MVLPGGGGAAAGGGLCLGDGSGGQTGHQEHALHRHQVIIHIHVVVLEVLNIDIH